MGNIKIWGSFKLDGKINVGNEISWSRTVSNSTVNNWKALRSLIEYSRVIQLQGIQYSRVKRKQIQLK